MTVIYPINRTYSYEEKMRTNILFLSLFTIFYITFDKQIKYDGLLFNQYHILIIFN